MHVICDEGFKFVLNQILEGVTENCQNNVNMAVVYLNSDSNRASNAAITQLVCTWSLLEIFVLFERSRLRLKYIGIV